MLLSRLSGQPFAYRAHHTLLELAPDAVLVGGSVRDLLLDIPLHDLDYVISGRAMPVARALADRLGGAFYPLDEDRDFGRVVWALPDGRNLVIDLAPLGEDRLDLDLRQRDFTLNAIALLPDGQLYDPLAGVSDLEQRRLRPCTEFSLEQDPLRVLRAVRFMYLFQLQADDTLAGLIRRASPGLSGISPERQRDELLKILALPEAEAAMRQFREWGLEGRFYPELAALYGIEQSLPHVYDVYEHTLVTLGWMSRIDRLIREQALPEGDLDADLLEALTPSRPHLRRYLEAEFVPERPRWLWLRFAALAHDWGKVGGGERSEIRDQRSEVRGQRTEDRATARPPDHATARRIRFIGHERVSAQLAVGWMQRFRCARSEVRFVQRVCQGHMRPIDLTRQPTRRSIYRFYRKLDEAAPGTLLLHIADHLATLGPDIDRQDFRRHLETVAAIVESSANAGSPQTAPPPLLNGNDLISIFDLDPGPFIGQLLEQVREAQAIGEVGSREQAIEFVRQILDS